MLGCYSRIKDIHPMAPFEDEPTWLRFRLRRLRAILRIVVNSRADRGIAEAALKELISEAENRLDELEQRARLLQSK